MRAINTLRGRSDLTSNPDTPEIRQCRYCKRKFEVDPKFRHKQFCMDTHRKLFWKYGSQSIGKLAERMERELRKVIERETKALRRELSELMERVDSLAVLVNDTRAQFGQSLTQLRERVGILEGVPNSNKQLIERADMAQGQLDTHGMLMRGLDARLRVLEARGGAGAERDYERNVLNAGGGGEV